MKVLSLCLACLVGFSLAFLVIPPPVDASIELARQAYRLGCIDAKSTNCVDKADKYVLTVKRFIGIL